MSNKIFKIFSVVFIITILIKILDVTKNLIIASMLGVSNEADVYSALILIPDSILVLVGIDSIRGVVNSEYSSLFSANRLSEIWESFNNLTKIVFIVSIPVTMIMILFNGFIIDALLPGFSENKKILAVKISYFIFPVLVTKGLIGYFQSVFNGIKKFYFPTIINGFLTISIFSSIFLPYINNELIYNLALANLIGNFIICIILIITLVKYGGRITFDLPKVDKISRIILKSCLSIFFLVMLNQLFMSSRNFFASYFGQGSIASLAYATTITGFITSMAFNSVFSVLLSEMSSSLHSKPRYISKNMFLNVLGSLVFVLIPVVVIFILLSKEILSVVYVRGNFFPENVYTVSNPFIWESIGILTWIFYTIPMALLLADKKYLTLLKIGLFSYSIGILLNYIFTLIVGFYGVSIGTSITFAVFGFIMIWNMRKKFGRFNRNFVNHLYLLLCGLCAAGVGLGIKYFFGQLDLLDKFYLTKEIIIISIVVIITYLFLSYLLRVSYLSNIISIFRNKA